MATTYNPYNVQPGGSYVEIPGDFPASLIDDYYRAVVASRNVQRQPSFWETFATSGADELNRILGSYIQDDIINRRGEDALGRDLRRYETQKQYDTQYDQRKADAAFQLEQQKRAQEGEALAALLEEMRPEPDQVSYVDEPVFNPNEPMDVPTRNPFAPPTDPQYMAPEDLDSALRNKMIKDLSVRPPIQDTDVKEAYSTPPGIEAYTEQREVVTPGKRRELLDAFANVSARNPLYAGVISDMLGQSGRQNILDPVKISAARALEQQRVAAARLSNTRADVLPGEAASRNTARDASVVASDARATRNMAEAERMLSQTRAIDQTFHIVSDVLNGVYGELDSAEVTAVLAAAGRLRNSFTPYDASYGREAGGIAARVDAGLPPEKQPAPQRAPQFGARDALWLKVERKKLDEDPAWKNKTDQEKQNEVERRFAERFGNKGGSNAGSLLEDIRKGKTGAKPTGVKPQYLAK